MRLVIDTPEIWQDIVGTGYSISSHGNVVSNTTALPIKPSINSCGYLQVILYTPAGRAAKRIHRLVGIAFVSGFSPELVVDHIDSNKLNNDPLNLQWLSAGDNTRKAWRDGLIRNVSGEAHFAAKLSDESVVQIVELLLEGCSMTAVGKLFGVCSGTISSIATGKNWKSSTASYREDLAMLLTKIGGKQALAGASNSAAKLDYVAVLRIKQLLSEGVAQPDIAEEFRVSRTAISDINCKRTWRHL